MKRPVPRRKKWTRGAVFLFLIVYLAAWVVIIYTMSDGYRTYRKLDARSLALDREKKMLQERLDQVRTAAGMRRADSPFFVEMVAREKLKMAKKGEVIIRLTGEDGTEDDGKTSN